MTDVTAPTPSPPATERPRLSPAIPVIAAEAEHRLITLVELLFFAYRDFTGEADAVLEELGLGRAHHRVLHFVNRNPGLRVADLLSILKITKQSLARVLKQLVDQGYVDQSAGEHDRRERRLSPTQKGTALARRLLALQTARMAQALETSGPDADTPTRRFLFAVISAAERRQVASLLRDTKLAT